jgi:phage tail sheath protein FI
MGTFIGRLQSPLVRDQARGAINTFLANMWDQGMLGDVTDVAKQPFSVVLDNSNNTPSRVALGYMQVDVRVTYLSVITKLLVNVEGGQSVRVSVASIAPQ